MSKHKVAKRKRAVHADLPSKSIKSSDPATPPQDASAVLEPKNLSTLLSDEEMELTIETLQTLTQYPNVIKSKGCRDLRAAVYDFRQACTTGVNAAEDTSLTARISASLTDHKYTDALILLAEMRIRNEAPKLGALCRWVRDLDTVSGLSMQVDGISHTKIPRSTKDLELLRVLDAILRVTGPTDANTGERPPVASEPISLQEVWNLGGTTETKLNIREQVLDGTILQYLPPGTKKNFTVIESTPGSQRKPPNLHDLILWLTEDNTLPFSASHKPLACHKHPHVPNLSLVKDLFTPEECKTIIAATESVGFLPDAPIRDDGAESSILAHNVCWVIDQAFHDRLWARVSPHVPSQVAGKKARGINRRFRVYRYVPGAEYRCHIDGAWPPSGVNPVTKAYQYDSSPPTAKQSSLFTFLIYLNDEFEGGETTFFIPSAREGVMNAYPVQPIMGSAAVFLHGEAKGALLHEGTGVRKGAKYIIRTEIEYDVVGGSD